jgi:hypothetical protein
MLQERTICLYKSTHLGVALEETLTHLSNTGEINDDMKEQFLNVFCDTLIETLQNNTEKTATISGFLETYRHMDDEWTFYVKNAKINYAWNTQNNGENTENVKMLKIVAVSSEHLKAEKSGEKPTKKRKLKESR